MPSTLEESAGFAQGYSQGLAAVRKASKEEAERNEAATAAMNARARSQHQQQQALAQSTLAALNSAVLPVVADAEKALLRYAVQLAEQLTGVHMRDGQSRAVSIAARILGQGSAAPVTVRVNPMDVHSVTELLATTPAVVTEDPSMTPGDAVATYPHGWLDARIGTALQRVKEQLETEDV
jgi:flagellar assembly protein FliH